MTWPPRYDFQSLPVKTSGDSGQPLVRTSCRNKRFPHRPNVTVTTSGCAPGIGPQSGPADGARRKNRVVLTWLQASDRRIVVRIPVGTRDFSLSISSKTHRSAVGHTQRVQRLFPMGDDDHSRLSCAEVKNEWSYTSPPLHAHTLINVTFCLADSTQHVHSPG